MAAILSQSQYVKILSLCRHPMINHVVFTESYIALLTHDNATQSLAFIFSHMSVRGQIGYGRRTSEIIGLSTLLKIFSQHGPYNQGECTLEKKKLY